MTNDEKLSEKTEQEKNEDETKKTLDELLKNYKELESYGYKLQELGVTIVEQSRIGDAYIQFQKSELPKYVAATDTFPDFNGILDNFRISSNIAITKTQVALDLIKKGESFVVKAKPYISSATSTCSSTVYSGIAMIKQTAINTGTDLYGKYNLHNPSIEVEQKIQAEIDEKLNKIDPKYIQRRQGAWTTFNSVSSDKKSQAAHSMRDIFRDLLLLWAPNKLVEQVGWWKKLGKDSVSHNDRIRFLLYGEKEIEDKTELESILKEVKSIDDNLSLLQGTAHGSDQEIQLVESTMKAIENSMLRIINLRNEK
jgi:hypothetical protein